MGKKDSGDSLTDLTQAEIADISEACRERITQCEKELNKQGYWNIALVAYQLKD